jgi:hypothetical protein
MVIHRLTGETYRALTVAPDWSVNKLGVHNAINRTLAARDTWQGKRHTNQMRGQITSYDSEGAKP